MDVIFPQYGVSKQYTNQEDDKSVYAQLLSSSVDTDPVTSIWSPTAEYTTGQIVYFLDTSGPCNGCWCQYKALQDMRDNTGTGGTDDRGKTPIDYTTYWGKMGSINMYKMFDQYSNTKTTDTNNITVTLYCRAISDIAFLRVQAKQIVVNVWNAVPSATYPYTANCTEDNKIITDLAVNLIQPIYNWSEYYWKPIEYIRDITKSIEVTLYNNLIVEIEFVKYDSIDCFVGTLIVGRRYDIGRLLDGVRTGPVDYSKIVFDENFGSLYAKEGNYRKKFEGKLRVPAQDRNMVDSVLTQLRAKPTIYQGNAKDTFFDSFLVYGIGKYTMETVGRKHICELEIQGMI